jgi:Type II secretory pathway, component PulD
VGNTVLKNFGVILCVAIMMFSGASLGQAQGAQPQQTWTINFKDSDIHEVIKFVAEVTGKTLVIDPRVKGRVKVISQKPLTERELMELFRSVLEVHDFTIVEVGNVVRVVPLKDARSSPLPVRDNPAFDEGYVTQVIQLKNIAAAKVLPVLRPLVPQHSHLAAYDPSNAIVVSDTAANIERIKEIIEKSIPLHCQ